MTRGLGMTRGHVLFVLLLSVACLAYFYGLDRFIFSSKGFSPIFHLLLTVYDVQSAWVSVAICLLAAIWNRPESILRVVDCLGRREVSTAVICAALFGLSSAAVYQGVALSMDEYAAVFQAEVFASGHIFASFPPSVLDWLVVPRFNGSFLIASPISGEVIEAYWPGFALLLAPFELVEIPWLCNAVLGATALFLIHRITLTLTSSRRAAGWSVLFAIASGAFWANAISFYSMQAHLTANLLFAWLLLEPNPKRAATAGFVGSLALVLHNPFPHALFALPWIISMAVHKDRRSYLLPLMLGYLPILLGVGYGWLALRTAIAPGGASASGAGNMLRGVFEWPNISILNMRAAALAKMWTWAFPGLFVFAVMGVFRHRTWQVRMLALSSITTFVGYLFVDFDQGHGWGYRYFHSAWGVVPILAGCGMIRDSGSTQRATSFAGASAILGFAILLPFQLAQMNGIITRHTSQLPPPQRPGNNVYFVSPGYGSYVADLVQADPMLRSRDLVLASRGSKADRELIAQNWPAAVKLAQYGGVEQWYLGPADQRRGESATSAENRFVLAYHPLNQSQ